MPERLDQVNVERFFTHGKKTGFGTALYEVVWHDGWMAKYKVIKVEEGSAAPLKKVNEGVVD